LETVGLGDFLASPKKDAALFTIDGFVASSGLTVSAGCDTGVAPTASGTACCASVSTLARWAEAAISGAPPCEDPRPYACIGRRIWGFGFCEDRVLDAPASGEKGLHGFWVDLLFLLVPRRRPPPALGGADPGEESFLCGGILLLPGLGFMV